MNQQTALQTYGRVELLIRAYEQHLFERVESADPAAPAALDALQTPHVMKQQENAEVMLSALESMQARAEPKKEEKTPEEGQETRYWDMGPRFGAGEGVQVSNTLGLIEDIFKGDDEETKKSLEKVWADCIPCLDRVRSASDIDFDDMKKLLQLDWEARMAWFDQFEAFMDQVDAYTDMCNLLDFLNFMCIPDLVMMLAVLKALLENEVNNLKNLSLEGMLKSLVSAILRPYIMGLRNLLEQWMQMIVAPLDCIIGALVTQMEKIPGTEDMRECLKGTNRAINRSSQALVREGESAGSALASTRGCKDSHLSGVQTMLGTLGDYLLRGESYIYGKLLIVKREQKRAMESDWFNGTKSLEGATQIKTILQLIAIVAALIKLASGDGRFCRSEDLNEEAIRDFVDEVGERGPLSPREVRGPDGDLRFVWEPREEGVPRAVQGPGGESGGMLPTERFSSFAKCMKGGRDPMEAEGLRRWIIEMEGAV